MTASQRPQPFGYCTNVHPGITLDDILSNLEQQVVAVKRQLGVTGEFPVGLWLSQTAVDELADPEAQTRLQSCLANHQLCPRTVNGFPCGDFHQPVVKQAVYRPSWAEPARLHYTQSVAELQASWLGPNQRGTLSTVPLGWPDPPWTPSMRQTAANQLLAYALFAQRLYDRTGTEIRLCLEPEPGCLFSRSSDLVDFFQEVLRQHPSHESLVRRYLGVCHDVCHAAVMFEPQMDAIHRYVSAGIGIYKVQISAALVADFDDRVPDHDAAQLKYLREYAEPKYLHQTMVSGQHFFEDLPAALAWRSQWESSQHTPTPQQWRVHFHVPIFARELPGGLRTTQDEIGECLKALKQQAGQDYHSWQRGDWDLEVETYAWHVLPDAARTTDLTTALAMEIQHGMALFAPQA